MIFNIFVVCIDKETKSMTWLSIQKPLPGKKKAVLILLSFVLPLLIWSAVSYLPFVWHPILLIAVIGLSTDMLLAWIGRNVFIWNGGRRNTFFQIFVETFTGPRDTTFTFLNKRDTRYERADTAQL